MTSTLPTVNAILNATAAILLVWGYTLIRRKRIDQHRRVMTTAFCVSCAFLVCYLVYHAQVGSVRFTKSGAIRTVYLTILATHTVLAAIVPFLAMLFGSLLAIGVAGAKFFRAMAREAFGSRARAKGGTASSTPPHP